MAEIKCPLHESSQVSGKEVALIQGDLWPVGFAANHANIERFIGYSFAQDLIDRVLDPEDLFDPSVIAS